VPQVWSKARARIRSLLRRRRRDAPPSALWEVPVCEHCGGWHDPLGVKPEHVRPQQCPRVKLLRFAVDGAGRRVTEVEYFAWRDWPQDRVWWPSEVPPAEETR
jgi:hypothetical protein